MRTLIAATVLLTSAAWSVDPSRRARELTDDERGLSAKTLAHYADAYRPEIRACYAEFAQSPRATGKVTLAGTILPGGEVIGLTIESPGVTGVERALLDQCIRMKVAEWHFPVRYDPTQFAIPYFFQKTASAHGPQYSCWNPHGCFNKHGKR